MKEMAYQRCRGDAPGENGEKVEPARRRVAACFGWACSVLTARPSQPREMEAPRWFTILFRWSLGLALVSWRYVWQTTPLHRTEEVGDVDDLPPSLPAQWVDERHQPWERGAGPLFHRVFAVCIDDPGMTARELISTLAADLNQAVPSEVTSVDKQSDRFDEFVCGNDLVVRMPGPWDGPVRVVDRTEASFRFATLAGHREAGQIEFRAQSQGGSLQFEIEAWARPGSPVVNLLYTHLRLAKEIQLNMWVRFCLATAQLAQGRVRGGVRIHTRVVEERSWRRREPPDTQHYASGEGWLIRATPRRWRSHPISPPAND